MRDREGLIARIRQIRRITGAAEEQANSDGPMTEPSRVWALEARVTHLEQLLEGLQDSVHRDVVRQDKRIAALEAQIEPAVLSRALSKDARERGL
jgi:uncharacterized coiled-coil protein SlyX